jgi:hypothetical protein
MMMVGPSTLVYAFALFVGALAGYVLKRLSVFEIKEWRKRKREKKKWLNQVERTANGIQRAWHFSGTRPEEEDRERTVDEMEELGEAETFYTIPYEETVPDGQSLEEFEGKDRC